jgi:hypothetical protein
MIVRAFMLLTTINEIRLIFPKKKKKKKRNFKTPKRFFFFFFFFFLRDLRDNKEESSA